MQASIPAGMTRRAAIAGLAGVAATAAGCTRRDSRTRLQFWAVGREGEVAAQLIRGFTTQHPDIDVQVQQLPGTAAHEKILTAYAGDTLPDVCQLGNTWVPELYALKALSPLDEFVSQSSVVAPDDYFEGIFNANRVGGALYGVPWYVDTRLLFYRRDLLQQAGFDHPPRDWAEWTQMLAAIKSLVGPERYSVLLPLNEFEPLLVLALQQPAELLRDGRWGNFRSEDFRHAMSFYDEMFRQQWAPRASNTQISNVWDEFSRGYFSFYISGPWQIGEFKRRLAPQLQDAWMTAPMPGPTGPGVSTAGGASLVIFEKSKHKRAAWQLIEYLSMPQTQRDFYELIGDLPPRRSVWESPVLAQSVYANAFHEQLARVRSPPKVPEWERIATQMRLMAERVVQNQVSLDAALADLDRQTDEILEKRRWMLDRHAQV
ncbi:MAG TPA: sugar ABC transporter substrate-binding protein [Povalibacter sp.]|nr:sugar ABC transporter substrate-binding protein [Povalibacter sp.]